MTETQAVEAKSIASLVEQIIDDMATAADYGDPRAEAWMASGEPERLRAFGLDI